MLKLQEAHKYVIYVDVYLYVDILFLLLLLESDNTGFCADDLAVKFTFHLLQNVLHSRWPVLAAAFILGKMEVREKPCTAVFLYLFVALK